MKYLHDLKAFLGEPYFINMIDGTECLCRTLENGYEFEIFKTDSLRVYVWSHNPLRNVAIYSGVQTSENLKALLGYLAVKYGNLLEQIQVEYEE